MLDPSLTPIQYPERKVLLMFTHPTVGDNYFQPMMEAAAREYFAADPMGSSDKFTASNGVQIDITWPESD